MFVAAGSTTVKSNQSNTGSSLSSKENTSFEYKFNSAIIGASGNKKDNANFTSTAAGTYE